VKPEEAIAELEAIKQSIESAMRTARAEYGRACVADIKAVWPVGDGPGSRSKDAWAHDDERGIHNDAPHVAFVHDGLASRIVPRILEDNLDIYESTLTAALDAARGG
jgi:hypothetical protein